MSANTWYVIFACFFSLAVVLTTISYYDNKSMNDATGEVFSKINASTTNKEIIDNIRVACQKIPWYLTTVDCEKKLLKTFITPTKSGD